MSDNVGNTAASDVAPALSQAADAAKYARDAQEIYEDQAEALSTRVQESPMLALVIAAGLGYILGRISR